MGKMLTSIDVFSCKYMPFGRPKKQCSIYRSHFPQKPPFWRPFSSSSSFFSHVARMPVDRSSCVDELNWCLDGCLLGILSWSSIYPFHTVSVVSTVSVKTSFETVHRWCHHHVLWQVVPQFYHSVAEEILP